MPRQLGRVACRQRPPQLSRIEPTSHPALTIRVPAPVGEGRALHTSSNPGTACPAGGTPTAGDAWAMRCTPGGTTPLCLPPDRGRFFRLPPGGVNIHTRPLGHLPRLTRTCACPAVPASGVALAPPGRRPGGVSPLLPSTGGLLPVPGCAYSNCLSLTAPRTRSTPGGSLTLASIQLTCPTSTPGVGYLNQILSLARAQVPSGLGWFPNIQGACPTSTPGGWVPR